VTKRGVDPLLSEAENTSELVGPPTDAEMETAITGNVANLMTVVRPCCGRSDQHHVLIFYR
jgi:calcium/calmodulin-dependent protein kinase kinase 2